MKRTPSVVAALAVTTPRRASAIAKSVTSKQPVLHVDATTIVSQYIGETEKNLDSLFRAAREDMAILFFDEADALFGKRTAVRDSHDRYANLEVSYLLRRIKESDGLAILATNLQARVDGAAVRRFDSLIRFPFPTAVARAVLKSQ